MKSPIECRQIEAERQIEMEMRVVPAVFDHRFIARNPIGGGRIASTGMVVLVVYAVSCPGFLGAETWKIEQSSIIPRVGAGVAAVRPDPTGSTPKPEQHDHPCNDTAGAREGIEAHLLALTETEHLPPLEYGPFEKERGEKNRWIAAEQRRRQTAIKALSSSLEGCSALLWISEIRGATTPWDIAKSMGLCLPFFVESDDLQKFLEAVPSIGAFCGAEIDIGQLDVSTVYAFSGIWRDWLQAARDADYRQCERTEIPGSSGYGAAMPAGSYLAAAACGGLAVVNDPCDLEMVREFHRPSAWDSKAAGSCARYLTNLGDPQDWIAVRSLQLADERTAWKAFAEGLYIEHSGKLRWSKYWPEGSTRPDLQRGLWAALAEKPGVRRRLIEAHRGASYSNSPLDGIRSVGHELDELKIKTMVDEAVTLEQEHLASMWLEALGRKDDLVDVGYLLRMSGIRAEPGSGNSRYPARYTRIQLGAQRAVVRQLLLDPEPTIDALAAWTTDGAEAFLSELIRSTRLFPHVGAQGPRCIDHLRYSIDRKRMIRSYASYQPVISQHRESLLKWIGRIDDPSTLAPVYALMGSSSSIGRLSKMVQAGSLPGIEMAWATKSAIDHQALVDALRLDKVSGWHQTMVELMLSEGGDSHAYETLAARLDSAPPFSDEAFRDPTAILVEMSRRGEWERLARNANRIAQNQDALVPADRVVSVRFVQAALVELLRNRPDLVRSKLWESLEIHELLAAVEKANSPNAEAFLQQLEPRVRKLMDQYPKLDRQWVAALTSTGTEWSRDMLVAESENRWTGAHVGLALLGDDRALDLSVAMSWRERQQIAVMLGRFDVVIAREPGSTSYRPYSRPIGSKGRGGLPVASDWPSRRLDQVIDSLLKELTLADARRRLDLILTLRPEREFWPDRLLTRLLDDEYGPMRLSALLYLLEYPRAGYEGIAEKMAEEDPYPWCRRLAREILRFKPDPLDPGEGIKFF